MAKLDTTQSYFLTYTDAAGVKQKIKYSDKISNDVLMTSFNDNPLVAAFFKPNSRLSSNSMTDWNVNQMKIMREKRQKVVVRDEKEIDFKTYEVDLTAPIKIYKFVQNTILANDDMLKNDVLLQSTVAKIQARNRAMLCLSVVSELLPLLEGLKIWSTSDVKQSTAQPAKATTTSATITALKKGQKVTGLITDLFADPTNTNADYNAFKIIWTAVKELKKLGTAKSKEQYYPFAENGFNNNQIQILASTELIEKIRANPAYKTVVMKQTLPNNKNEFMTQTAYINGIEIIECNQLEHKIEAVVMTKDAVLVGELPIKSTPLAKIIQGDGAIREIDGAQQATPMDALLLMSEGKFAGGFAFPSEIIIIRSA